MSEISLLLTMAGEFVTPQGGVVLVPLLAAAGLAFLPDARLAGWLNALAASATFALACVLPFAPHAGPLLLVEPLSAALAVLTAFVGMSTAWFSRAYIGVAAATGRFDRRAVRAYHALYQIYLGFLLLGLLANNLPTTWGAIEVATLAGVMVVGLPGTEQAVGAAWKMFILCGVGISLAFFGTTVLYLAAVPALGPGLAAMSWSELQTAAPRMHGAMLNLAFVFLLIGYGTKAGLVPLHAWMPDAHAQGPTPVSAVLSGSVLNVALLVILRLRGLLAANPDAIAPGPPIIALGLASVLIAAFSLWRRRDIKRFFAYSTIEQSGVVAFAFGLGGPAAIFAGLLHMMIHTLAKAAVFFCVGRAAQLKGGQLFADVHGLLANHRALGLTLAGAVLAVAGLPPFGLFASEFLVFGATLQTAPLLALPLGIGLLVGGWALMTRLAGLCLGPATADRGPTIRAWALWPAWLHLALGLGLAMPGPLAAWLTAIARSAAGGGM